MAIFRRQTGQAGIGLVPATVVDHDDLVGSSERFERAVERLVQRLDVVLLVVHGNHDRELDSRLSIGLDDLERLLGRPL